MSDLAYGFTACCAYLLAIPRASAVSSMANPFRESQSWAWTPAQQRRHLSLCLALECDIDPMILRARQLRHQGALPQASCVEQELLPLF
jgi:hypothetical protein